jgi:formylglycine-generating enzyme required for sulfatase activity
VRARLYGIYNDIESGKMALSRHVGRVLFMTFEHEAMHAETLLYMLLQSPHTLPPSTVATPQWDVLAHQWAEQADGPEYKQDKLLIAGRDVVLGHNDREEDDKRYPTAQGWENHELGWDLENPKTTVPVKTFEVDALPICNQEYFDYLVSTHQTLGKANTPASWVEEEGEWKVRTLYGPVGMQVAGKWPLMASKVEIDRYAKSKGGRMPTEAELRLVWESEDGPRPAERANVGFKNWHPIP